MKKRVVSMALALLLVLSLCSILSVSAVSDKCGPNAYWAYSNGVLTISGSGAVYLDYGAWFSNLNISSVVIQKGITSIGSDFFVYSYSGITSVHLPEGLKEIGDHAFAGQALLKELYIPSTVTKIGKHAFGKNCDVVMAMCEGFYDADWPDKNGYEQKGYSFKPVIYGKTGSTAEKYAKQNGIAFKAVCDKFTDVVKTDWYHKNGAIHYCADKKLFSGTSATTFGPTKNMTRAMFVTVLGRLDGKSVNHNVKTAFTDVKKNQYYTGYVKWAYENEIVSGTSKTKFEPNANITREQICAMMQRYSNYAGIRIKQYYKVMTFTDAAQISSWAKDAVRACQQGGLVTGEKVGASYRFRPKGNATRAEVATIIMNFAEKHK